VLRSSNNIAQLIARDDFDRTAFTGGFLLVWHSNGIQVAKQKALNVDTLRLL